MKLNCTFHIQQSHKTKGEPSNENKAVTEPAIADIVTVTPTPAPLPLPDLHTIPVSVLHVGDEQAVPDNAAACPREATPKLSPPTLMLPRPEVGPLRLSRVTTGAAKHTSLLR